MKRILDLTVALVVLALTSPILLAAMLAIWLDDRQSPFYVAPRVGLDGRSFRMVKLRSMRTGAAASGVDSTAADDPRITRVGRLVRRWKLDEVPQLWNVVRGEMSLVGPRPNVARETDLYTDEERRLLSVKPGVTDFASIVFADEAEILDGSADPDLAYNQLIRPWKSRLGLLYVARRSFRLDLRLLLITAVAMVARPRALAMVVAELERLEADPTLRRVSARQQPLSPHPPPGSDRLVTSRDGHPNGEAGG